MTSRAASGAIGVARMSNLPHRASRADSDECIGEILIKFNVSFACSTKSSQNDSGQLGTNVAMTTAVSPIQNLLTTNMVPSA